MTKAPIKITLRSVGAISPGSKDEFYWDADLKGFGLKVTPPSGKHPAGTKTYVYQYRMGGRATPARRVTIGRHGSPWTPTTAREEAERLALMVGRGIDPVRAASDHSRKTTELNFGKYAEGFIKDWLPKNWPGHHVTAAQYLRLHAIPMLGKKSLPEIGKADITALMKKLEDRPATAFGTYAVLRRMFRVAVEQTDDLPKSIFDEMTPPPKPKARERVLTHEEIDLFWHAAGDYGYYYGKFMQMLLLTGQRRTEVAHLPWAELSRKRRLWELGSSRAKNDNAHLIPLSDLAIALLDEVAKKQTGRTDAEWPRKGFVFTIDGESPLNNFSHPKTRVANKMVRLAKKRAKERGEDPTDVQIPNWCLHDIRRTIPTDFQRLGIRWEVNEAILNHVGGAREGVAGVYQRHKWLREKRLAMQAWADRLKLILAGGRFDDEMEEEFDEFESFDNVVPIAAARS